MKTAKQQRADAGFIAGCDDQAQRLRKAAPKMRDVEAEAALKAAAIYAALAKAKRAEIKRAR